MFTQDKPRTFKQNLRLASMLSTVAGMVNVVGVLSIGTLTTNVTGHFAYFAEEVVRGELPMAAAFLTYILSFLSGAFLCGLVVQLVSRKHPSKSHTLPLILETVILLVVMNLSVQSATTPEWIARMLLFAMGLQNAMVTHISKATVRTTHLTGLFTDLGIELSQLFFFRKKEESAHLTRSVYLRLAIIGCFFLGGIVGGFVFKEIGIYALSIATAILGVALIYDNARARFSYRGQKLEVR